MVGHRGWTQMLDADVGIEVGRKGWTQRMGTKVGHRRWTHLGWMHWLDKKVGLIRLDTEVGRIVLESKVGRSGWTQRLDAVVGQQRMDTAGWMQRLDT